MYIIVFKCISRQQDVSFSYLQITCVLFALRIVCFTVVVLSVCFHALTVLALNNIVFKLPVVAYFRVMCSIFVPSLFDNNVTWRYILFSFLHDFLAFNIIFNNRY